MPRLIKNCEVVDDDWVLIDKEESLEGVKAESADKVIVFAGLWLEHKQELQDCGKTVGVWLDSDQHPDIIADSLTELPLVALNFPKFTDGRGFSSAAVLRQHFDYQGEIRAIGDVLPDQLFYLRRCGFDSFVLGDDVKVEDALSAFEVFHATYSATVQDPRPLFRRRQV